jgi:hypothetical protein
MPHQLNAYFRSPLRASRRFGDGRARPPDEVLAIPSLTGEGRFLPGRWEVFAPAEAHRPHAVLSGALMWRSFRRPQSGGREPSVQLRSGFRLTGASQKEIASRAGRDSFGFVPENLRLFVEALLKGLLVLDA